MDQGEERTEDMTTGLDENDETVFEADTAELRTVSAASTTPGKPPDAGELSTNGTAPSEDGAREEAADTLATPALEPSESVADAGSADAGSEERPPLMAGIQVGGYRIEQVLQSSAAEARYLAVEAGEDAAESTGEGASTPPAAHVVLIERAPGGFAAATELVALRLRHPRLLAPREVITHAGREYLVVETLVGSDSLPAKTVEQGARLDPAATLAAGAGLADTLSYLHRNAVAHLHVSPDAIIVHGERAHLAGMESAERVPGGTSDLAELYARDANFLARSLGVLAGLSEERDPHEDSARDVLRQIVAYGAANAFTSVDDVAATCAAALQTTPAFSLTGEAATGRLAFVSAAATSVGRVRSENQDACARIVFDIYDDVSGDMPINVFVVADGMGGEARGEIASRIAARTVPAELARSFAVPETLRPVEAATEEEPSVRIYGGTTPSLSSALSRAVNEANRRVRELAALLRQTTGTTLTVVATRGNQAALAHLGDSRAYLLRGDTMAQLTEDHSVLARLQAIDHPLLSDPDVFVPRNMLYRSLGQEDEANPDTLDFALTDGDRILLCSDGLWDELDDQIIAETLAEAADPRGCAERLVTLANAAGGHDNSTALVIFIQSSNPLDYISGDDPEKAPPTEETEETSRAEEL